ncbi:MAG: 2Fe-2S iron-sulfur cluster binding domain-containing protein [Flavobacteriales bacterium]|nr:2Fe-2S iron-sulfur cluster binding domain-containing protein [Flavobacteriales bacterium]
MAHFYPLRVARIERLTSESVAITLDPAASGGNFSFIPGQYLTLKLQVDGHEYRRSYSISSAPNESMLTIGVKAIPNGTVSVYMNQNLKEGDVLQSMEPMGNFHPIMSSSHVPKHFVCFAAGSGITPILSIIKWATQLSQQHKVTLFYGNTSHASAMFHNELSQLAQAHEGLDVIHLFTDRSSGVPLESGRIDFQKTWDLMRAFVADDLPKSFFICGPSGMMKAVQEGLEGLGYYKDQIHMEHFSEPDVAPVQKEVPVVGEGTQARVMITLDGTETQIMLDPNGDSILDAALDHGLDAPYSCRGGVCTTCRAKVTEGVVEMDNNYALTDGEINEGYVLACQSHPKSAVVRLTWD